MLNFFDLGAHRGAYITAFLIYAKEHGIEDYHIYAVEPKTECFTELVENYKQYGNIRLFKYALANKNGIAHLYENDHYAGDSIMMIKEGNHKKYQLVDTMLFSSFVKKFCTDFKTDINLVKMNIEGAELMVMRDIVRCGLHRYIKLFYGSWGDLYKMGKHTQKMVNEFLELLTKHKIEFYLYQHNDFWKCLDEVLK